MASDVFLNDILKLVVMVSTTVPGFESCSLWLVSGQKETEQIPWKVIHSREPEQVPELSPALSRGIVSHVVNSREVLIVENLLTDPRFRENKTADKTDRISLIGIPMIDSQDDVIGVLNCFTTPATEFSKTDILEMTAIAGQAAAVVTRTRQIMKSRLITEEFDTRELLGRARMSLMHRCGLTSDQTDLLIHNTRDKRCISSRAVAEAVLLCN